MRLLTCILIVVEYWKSVIQVANTSPTTEQPWMMDEIKFANEEVEELWRTGFAKIA